MLVQVLSLLPSLEDVPPAALSVVESSPQAQASLLEVEAAETQSQGQGAPWPQGLCVCVWAMLLLPPFPASSFHLSSSDDLRKHSIFMLLVPGMDTSRIRAGTSPDGHITTAPQSQLVPNRDGRSPGDFWSFGSVWLGKDSEGREKVSP